MPIDKTSGQSSKMRVLTLIPKLGTSNSTSSFEIVGPFAVLIFKVPADFVTFFRSSSSNPSCPPRSAEAPESRINQPRCSSALVYIGLVRLLELTVRINCFVEMDRLSNRFIPFTLQDPRGCHWIRHTSQCFHCKTRVHLPVQS